MQPRPSPTLSYLGPAAVDPPRRRRPVGAVPARLGFPSPAEDFADGVIDLNELLVSNEPATFYYRARGRSQESRGIFDGDILAVDRSLTPVDGDLVVAVWEGNAPACKLLRKTSAGVVLESDEAPIVIGADVVVEAFVVTGVVRKLHRGGPSRVRSYRRK